MHAQSFSRGRLYVISWNLAHQAQKTWLYNWLAFLLYILFLQVCLLCPGQCFMRPISKVYINGVFLLFIFWLKLIKGRHQQESGGRKEGEVMLFTHQPCPFHNILFLKCHMLLAHIWHISGMFRDAVTLMDKTKFFFSFKWTLQCKY